MNGIIQSGNCIDNEDDEDDDDDEKKTIILTFICSGKQSVCMVLKATKQLQYKVKWKTTDKSSYIKFCFSHLCARNSDTKKRDCKTKWIDCQYKIENEVA